MRRTSLIPGGAVLSTLNGRGGSSWYRALQFIADGVAQCQEQGQHRGENRCGRAGSCESSIVDAPCGGVTTGRRGLTRSMVTS